MWLEEVHKIKNSPNPEHIKSTIFEGVLNSKLPEAEKSDARLAHEAQLVVFAGQGTTAYTLSAAIYELLANPDELKKVKQELESALPDPGLVPSYSQLESLPYFSAALQEVLRLHPGIVSRIPRISPNAPIVYTNKRDGKTYVVPAGTPTNITIQVSHQNPEAFSDPTKFLPQRWIDNPRLDRAFVGFARGTRNCIGFVSYGLICDILSVNLY
jgi:cytochrome P450